MITCSGPRADGSPCTRNSSSSPEYVMGCVEGMLSDESCRIGIEVDSASYSGLYISTLVKRHRVVLISWKVVWMPRPVTEVNRAKVILNGSSAGVKFGWFGINNEKFKLVGYNCFFNSLRCCCCRSWLSQTLSTKQRNM